MAKHRKRRGSPSPGQPDDLLGHGPGPTDAGAGPDEGAGPRGPAVAPGRRDMSPPATGDLPAGRIVYVDEQGYADDGTYVGLPVETDDDGYGVDGPTTDRAPVAAAVYVDEDGYAEDGTFVGLPVYVDEDGYTEDGTYVGYVDEGGGSGDPGDPHQAGYELGPAVRPRRRRHHHPILAVFVIVVVVIVLVAGGGIIWAAHEINPGGHPGHDVTVTIAKGEATDAIGRQLTKAGVIHGGATLFRYYVRLEGDGPLLPGTYRLATNETYDSVITKLETPGATLVDTLVIPEGFTLREIAVRAAAMPGMHFSAAQFVALSRSGSVRSPYEPKRVNDLEGLVFPATYQFDRGTSPTAILTLLVQTFDTKAHGIGLNRAARLLHKTPYQVITVASIIQGEAKFASDGPDVASVIYNRLKDDIALGTDSTLIYALRQHDPDLNVSKVNYEQPNPYNTRLHKGLPPTPIDNPSTTFLEAAMRPPTTKLLYFLEEYRNGKLGFASTAAGDAHLVAVCKLHHLC